MINDHVPFLPSDSNSTLAPCRLLQISSAIIGRSLLATVHVYMHTLNFHPSATPHRRARHNHPSSEVVLLSAVDVRTLESGRRFQELLALSNVPRVGSVVSWSRFKLFLRTVLCSFFSWELMRAGRYKNGMGS